MYEREVEIYWLNWQDTLDEAVDQRDLSAAGKAQELLEAIAACCGKDKIVNWAVDEPMPERNYELTVYFRINCESWPWELAANDLLQISTEFPDEILLIRFWEREASGDIFFHNGRITTCLFESDTGDIIECF